MTARHTLAQLWSKFFEDASILASYNGWLAVAVGILAFSILFPAPARAQCYLSQGCKPVDYLNYVPNGTGQVFHGDGASNDGAGGWTNAYADVNQCLSCHYTPDKLAYLKTGHRNTLRKLAPGTLWGGPDSAPYSTTDAYYGSASTYDWVNNTVTVGQCDIFTMIKNGLAVLDPNCSYPYYTQTNPQLPSYPTVAPTVAAGGVRDMYYIFAGWLGYGGTAHPEKTTLGTVFDQGFTGEIYPDGNFSCARCHTTGYNFDASGPEPTQNTNDVLARIPDSKFSRIPSDGYIAPGTSGTSSWYLTGITCERCHVAAWGYGSHPYDNVQPTIAENEAATALCLQCHRGENITMADPNANPPVQGSIDPSVTPETVDHGYCSDLSGTSYSDCVSNGSTWVYKPSFQYEAGPAFLNSPHARFDGTIVQNQQNSPDLSVTLSGTYDSYFSENPSDPTANKGCTGCHNPHESTVAAANAPNPFTKRCVDCHALSQTILQTTKHPSGPGTPFPTGTAADIPGSCPICHMVAANGTPKSHLFRINTDPGYYTYPTAAQLHTQGITAPNTAPDTSRLNGSTYTKAAWLDVDLACGQCHVGNDGVTNEYNLTPPPGLPGSHAFTRAELAQYAITMHGSDPGVPNPTFDPPAGSYTSAQTVTISDAQSGATIYYTTDGSIPTANSAVYSAPLTISASTVVQAVATYPGLPMSSVAFAQYSITLPQAPAPQFSPTPSQYSSAVSVSLSNSASLPMYYTTDGSTPTTKSTPYSSSISVTQNTTIKAITAGAGYSTSLVATGTYTIQAPAPTFSPSSGTYSTAQTVTISDAAGGATIYYTTNGLTPNTSSTSCSNPCSIQLSTTTTLKAIASGGGFVSSNVAFASYTFATATPSFSPGGGTYYTPQTVTISDATSGATIYYTTNGLTPTTSSTSCSSPCSVQISTTTTLKAMAQASGLSQSSIAWATYTIKAATPTFSPGGGTYTGPQTVTISDATSGVTIYYTTDGSFPNTSSASCTSPCGVSVPTSLTIRAMATGGGYSQSSYAYAFYTIQ